MLRYGTYTRKSDDDRSVTEKSISEQVTECARIAERDGLAVVKTWEESRSARHPHRRQGYKELIALVERGRIDAIICWHVNRLVRNMEEGGKLAQLLIEGKVKEIRTPSATYRTGDNIMPLVIEAASATQFSLDHSRTVGRGMDGSFRSGGCTNLAPQGYRNSRDPINLKKGQVERDPDRFGTVRRAWELMLTGTRTVRQVTDTMNQAWGFRTKPTKKRGDRPLSYTGAYSMFTNPFYAGFVHRKGELVKGRHEAMVTSDEFEQVQAILRRRSFSAPRRKEYPFTGLMRCVHCGQQVTAETKRLRDGRLWENYHCSDSRLRCTKLGLSGDKVQAKIAAELDSLEIDEDLLAIAVENILRSLGRGLEDTGEILKSQEHALRQANHRLARLSDMWLDGIVTEKERYREMEERELARKMELTLETERIRHEAERMRTNLERGALFLNRAREELGVSNERRKKEIAGGLATDYRFDGRAKRIEIQVHPLLSEMVSYARKMKPLEPRIAGSQKQKEPASEKPVLSGGRECRRIGSSPTGNGFRHVEKLPGRLVEALRGPTFPDMWPQK